VPMASLRTRDLASAILIGLPLFPNARFLSFHCSFGLMTKFDRRIAANLEVALETVCQELSHGGDHETRKRIAEELLQAAESGNTTLGELEAVGRKALLEAKRKSA
jgi:hypothetical protein